jgi:hypothetical protein
MCRLWDLNTVYNGSEKNASVSINTFESIDRCQIRYKWYQSHVRLECVTPFRYTSYPFGPALRTQKKSVSYTISLEYIYQPFQFLIT